MVLLSVLKNVLYMDYVAEIKKNPIAKSVKLADLKHNSDLSRLDIVDEKATLCVMDIEKLYELDYNNSVAFHGSIQDLSRDVCFENAD